MLRLSGSPGLSVSLLLSALIINVSPSNCQCSKGNPSHPSWISTEKTSSAAVHWPGLASHPDHKVARRLLSGYGGMVAFDVTGGREAGLRFIAALRLAAMAPSLGGVETLVLHPASTSHRQLDAAGLRAAGIGEGSIRVSVGLEHPEDLWADFEQALAAAHPA